MKLKFRWNISDQTDNFKELITADILYFISYKWYTWANLKTKVLDWISELIVVIWIP